MGGVRKVIFAKEKMRGYYGANVGELSEEWTHAVLSKEEYWQARTEREELRRDLARATREKETYQKEYSQAEQENRKLRASQTELEERAAAAEETAGYQKRLNENLLRMNRERANAERELRPKKKHPGYVVLSSGEKMYRFKEGKEWRDVPIWETRLQSPYNVEFTAEQARWQMIEEMESGGEIRLLEKLGIRAFFPEGYEQLTADSLWNEERYNAAFELWLRANYRSGYWEGFLRHTEPLGIVPKELRPQKRKKAPEGGDEREEEESGAV